MKRGPEKQRSHVYLAKPRTQLLEGRAAKWSAGPVGRRELGRPTRKPWTSMASECCSLGERRLQLPQEREIG